MFMTFLIAINLIVEIFKVADHIFYEYKPTISRYREEFSVHISQDLPYGSFDHQLSSWSPFKSL